MGKKVSSLDVAKEAGVSRATVSYILNDVENVKIRPETRARVLEAVQKLGYHPNSTARALKTNKSMTIGVVSKRDVDEERFSKVLKGIKKVLDHHNYSILLCSDEEDINGKSQYYNYYKQQRIDGVLLLSYIESMDILKIRREAALIKQDRVPAIFIDYHMNDPVINCVDLDYYHGGYIAMRHLIEKNHKKVFYLDPGTDTIQEKERIRGVYEALLDADLDMSCLKVAVIKADGNGMGLDIDALLKSTKEYTALLAGWVNYGLKTLQTCSSIGIKVPEELAVMALADSRYTDLCYPRLSVSELPLYEAGRKSAERLMDLLKENSMPINIKLPCSLMLRDSS